MSAPDRPQRKPGMARVLGCLALINLYAWHGNTALAATPVFHDSHFHLTNYVQEGTDIRDYVAMMGDTIGRSTVFGIPLQQQWSHGNTGDWAPTFYLQTDAPLYYYSFSDDHIAMAYRSLPAAQQARLVAVLAGPVMRILRQAGPRDQQPAREHQQTTPGLHVRNSPRRIPPRNRSRRTARSRGNARPHAGR